jgi:hypothetical protein
MDIVFFEVGRGWREGETEKQSLWFGCMTPKGLCAKGLVPRVLLLGALRGGVLWEVHRSFEACPQRGLWDLGLFPFLSLSLLPHL